MMTAKGARLAVQNIEPRTPNGCKAWVKIAEAIEDAVRDGVSSTSFIVSQFHEDPVTDGELPSLITPDDSEIHRVVQALKVYGYDVVKTKVEWGIVLDISWKDDESSIGYLKRQYEYYGNKLRERGVLR